MNITIEKNKTKTAFRYHAITENSPGVLQRIATIFTRRKINIERLHVQEMEQQGFSEFSILVACEAHSAIIMAKQIARIIEVLDVSVMKSSSKEAEPFAKFVNSQLQEQFYRAAKVEEPISLSV